MGIAESNVVQECRKAASQCGARVFRNNRGMFYTLDLVAKIFSALKGPNPLTEIKEILRSARKVRAGLEVPGSSDLIGWTADGRFLALECKAKGGRATPEQLNFIEQVKKAGGVGGVVYGKDCVYRLLKPS